jgi:hypothetical protein
MYNIGRNIIFLFVVFVIFSGCQTKTSKIADNKKNVSNDSSLSSVAPIDSSLINATKKSGEQKAVVNYADFIVLSFTSQDWHGGIKGSGGGTNYEITAVSKQSSANLIIDQLWIGQKYYEITVSKKFPSFSADGFSANDTIYIHASDYRKDPDFNRNIQVTDSETKQIIETAEAVNIDPPYAYQGVALIGYKLNGQHLYIPIDKIVKKAPLFYP